MRSRFPSSSCCASSFLLRALRSSCRLPSSQLVLFRLLGPCRQWRASSLLLWEAYLMELESNSQIEVSWMSVVYVDARDSFGVVWDGWKKMKNLRGGEGTYTRWRQWWFPWRVQSRFQNITSIRLSETPMVTSGWLLLAWIHKLVI